MPIDDKLTWRHKQPHRQNILSLSKLFQKVKSLR